MLIRVTHSECHRVVSQARRRRTTYAYILCFENIRRKYTYLCSDVSTPLRRCPTLVMCHRPCPWPASCVMCHRPCPWPASCVVCHVSQAVSVARLMCYVSQAVPLARLICHVSQAVSMARLMCHVSQAVSVARLMCRVSCVTGCVCGPPLAQQPRHGPARTATCGPRSGCRAC